MRQRIVFACVVVLLFGTYSFGQGLITPRRHPEKVESNTGDQQTTSPITNQNNPQQPLPNSLPVSAIKLKLKIVGQIATVRVEHLFRNDTDENLEGTYYFPVPEGASLLEFAVYDGDQRRVGRVKEKEEARIAYAAAAAQGEDPAILEMTKKGWFQSHVYPIPPHADKRVEIVYSQLLTEKKGSISFDYALGQGYKKLKVPVGSVEIDVDLSAASEIKNVFSSSHPIDLQFDGDRHVTGKISTVGGGDAENFLLNYSLADRDVSMSLITYRKEGEDGYFLMMLTPNVNFEKDSDSANAERRVSAKDVVFVIDVSGSMEGDKLRQAKEALLYGLQQTLSEGDLFNIVVFSSNVRTFSPTLIPVTRESVAKASGFVSQLNVDGGTNINDALIAAMKLFESNSHPHNLVFLTDGQPSASVNDPSQIAANVRAANKQRVRLFSFGVGSDVNRVLLEKLAMENRGADSNIANTSELKTTISNFFAKVSRPVLSELHVDFGQVQVARTHPAELQDLYTRGQIKIFGRYSNPEDLRDVTVSLTGRMAEAVQRFDFSGLNFPLKTEDSNFLPKLWANERVAALLSQIRLYGETAELKQEVIQLARDFNLVTPYTSMYVPTTNELLREKSTTESVTAEGVKLERISESQIAGVVNHQQINNLPINGRKFSSVVSIDGGRVTQSGGSAGPAPPGTIVDANGAVVPGATVTMRDQNTGATRTVQTDASGNYSVAGLPPGNYSIAVAAPGFQQAQVSNVTVTPGQVVATGVELNVAAVTETVSVMNVAQSLEKAASNITTTLATQTMKDLPSLDPVEMFSLLVPGITSVKRNHSTSSAAPLSTGTPGDRADVRFSINGARPLATSHTLNGADNNSLDGQPSILIRNFEAVQMLHIATTRGASDVGLTGASSVNLQMRTGANEFHGTAFGYYLNRGIGALSPLERRNGLSEPPNFSDTIWGGAVGGPIKRDRLFFFGSVQGENGRASRFFDSTSSYLTPTAEGLENLLNAFSQSPTLADLMARGPLVHGVGEAKTTRLFQIPIGGSQFEFGELARLVPSATKGFELNGLVNWSITDKDQLAVAYWFDRQNVTNSIGNLLSGNAGDAGNRAQLAHTQWVRNLSPRAVNQLEFAFNRSRLAVSDGSEGTELTASSLASVNPGVGGLSYGSSLFLPSRFASNLFELADTLTYQKGRHNIKLGVQWRRRDTDIDDVFGTPGGTQGGTGRESRGQYYFANLDDFVLNQPAALSVLSGDGRVRFGETHQHYFADDAWRIFPHLTVSMGLSYETANQPINSLAKQLREREASASTALFDTALPIEVRTIAEVKRDANNFAPRLGFAYTPNFRIFGKPIFGREETVIRGGISYAYDRTAYFPLRDIARSAPNVVSAVLLPGSGFPLSQFPQIPNADSLLEFFHHDPRQMARAELAGDYRTPYSMLWHLTLSRSFQNRLVFEAGYIGNRGFRLTRLIDSAAVSNSGTNAAPLRTYESTGHASYHGLQTKAVWTFTNRLSGGISYTWSKSTDDVPGMMMNKETGGTMILPLGLAQNPFDVSQGERALSDFHRRHVVVGHFLWTLPSPLAKSKLITGLLDGWQASGIIEGASGSPYTAYQYLGQSGSSVALYTAMFADRLGGIRPFRGNTDAPIDTVAFSNAANAYYRFFTNPDGTPISSPTGFIIADRTSYRNGQSSEARFIYNDYGVEAAARRLGLPADAYGQTFAAGRAFGDEGRNTLFSPSLANVNFAMMKKTKLNERITLQIRGEFFNLFNHPNRGRANFLLENAGGRGFADVDETDAVPRRIRIALKLLF